MMHFQNEEENISEIGLFTFYKQQQESQERFKVNQFEVKSKKKKMQKIFKTNEKESIIKTSYNKLQSNKQNPEPKSMKIKTQANDNSLRIKQKYHNIVTLSNSKILDQTKTKPVQQIHNLRSCAQFKRIIKKQEKFHQSNNHNSTQKMENKIMQIATVLFVLPQAKDKNSSKIYQHKTQNTQPNSLRNGHTQTYEFYQNLAYRKTLKNGLEKLKSFYNENSPSNIKKQQNSSLKQSFHKNSKISKFFRIDNSKLSETDFKSNFLKKLRFLQNQNQITNAIYKENERNNKSNTELHEQNKNYINNLIQNNYLRPGSTRNVDKILRQALKLPDLKLNKNGNSERNSSNSYKKQKNDYRNKIIIREEICKLNANFGNKKKLMFIQGKLIKNELGGSIDV